MKNHRVDIGLIFLASCHGLILPSTMIYDSCIDAENTFGMSLYCKCALCKCITAVKRFLVGYGADIGAGDDPVEGAGGGANFGEGDGVNSLYSVRRPSSNIIQARIKVQRYKKQNRGSEPRKNKAGYAAAEVGCGWARAIFEVTIWARAVRSNK